MQLDPWCIGQARQDNDTAFSVVVRHWEHRSGARVIAVGFSALHLSVAAPPMNAGSRPH
ncbi:DUF4253 domain-containing protein [Streptomyces sp. NBC_00691]|uniref:DUF4253 domain-containing protein n=1 Tax=Streptomyces sp. NBC_00691 TaxID=2903671 RepID=UPI003FA7E514